MPLKKCHAKDTCLRRRELSNQLLRQRNVPLLRLFRCRSRLDLLLPSSVLVLLLYTEPKPLVHIYTCMFGRPGLSNRADEERDVGGA